MGKALLVWDPFNHIYFCYEWNYTDYRKTKKEKNNK